MLTVVLLSPYRHIRLKSNKMLPNLYSSFGRCEANEIIQFVVSKNIVLFDARNFVSTI